MFIGLRFFVVVDAVVSFIIIIIMATYGVGRIASTGLIKKHTNNLIYIGPGKLSHSICSSSARQHLFYKYFFSIRISI